MLNWLHRALCYCLAVELWDRVSTQFLDLLGVENLREYHTDLQEENVFKKSPAFVVDMIVKCCFCSKIFGHSGCKKGSIGSLRGSTHWQSTTASKFQVPLWLCGSGAFEFIHLLKSACTDLFVLITCLCPPDIYVCYSLPGLVSTNSWDK